MAAAFDVVQSAAEFTREKRSPVSMATATGRMLSLKGSREWRPNSRARPLALFPFNRADARGGSSSLPDTLAEAVLHCAGRNAGALKEIHRLEGIVSAGGYLHSTLQPRGLGLD